MLKGSLADGYSGMFPMKVSDEAPPPLDQRRTMILSLRIGNHTGNMSLVPYMGLLFPSRHQVTWTEPTVRTDTKLLMPPLSMFGKPSAFTMFTDN